MRWNVLIGAALVGVVLFSHVPGNDLNAKASWLAEHGFEWVAERTGLEKVSNNLYEEAAKRPGQLGPKPNPQRPPGNKKKLEVLESVEDQVIDLINKDRAKFGLGKLVTDPVLTAIARDRARDMIEREYFAHTTPDGQTVVDYLKKVGYPDPYAGENIGTDQVGEATLIHQGYKHSSRHAANMWNSRWTHVGIGVLRGDPVRDFSKYPDRVTSVEIFAQKK